MLIAHISDFHIMKHDTKTCGVVPAAQQVSKLIAHINSLSPAPDLVLVTGDLTHDGTLEQAREARRILSDLRMPWYLVPGNHDQRDTLKKVFAPDACPSRDENFLHFQIDLPSLRLIGLDSTRPDAPGGMLCPQRADWLENRLDERPDKPTLLFLHHPPTNFGVPETDQDGFEGAERLGQIVEQHPCIERILCGHIHLNASTCWHGVLVNTAPSAAGMELTLSPGTNTPSGFHLVDPAYLLHFHAADGGLVTHQVQVRDNLATHAF